MCICCWLVTSQRTVTRDFSWAQPEDDTGSIGEGRIPDAPGGGGGRAPEPIRFHRDLGAPSVQCSPLSVEGTEAPDHTVSGKPQVSH